MNARIVRLAGLVGAVALMPALASAQDSKPISVGVMGGIALPIGDLGDAVESGYNITGSVYLRPGAGNLSFRGDVGYESFQAKGSSNLASLDLNVLSVTGNVLFPLGSAVAEGGIRPYLIGGGGLYRTSYEGSVGGVSGSSSSSNDLGIGVGGGVEFRLAGFSTFAEARFVNVFGDDNDNGSSSARWIPVTFGIRF